jgi:oleandomycin transport system ATP-binding protein
VLDPGRVIAAGTPASLKAEIGGQRLQVRPVHRADMPLVSAVVAELAPGQDAVVDASGELVVPALDPGLLRRVGDRLDESGVAVAEIGLRLPSLDDVFLTLTGRTAEVSAGDDAEEAA